MIKVNLQTLKVSRDSIPLALIGLSDETLRNLQTELNPVPDEFKDIEFWDEVDNSPALVADQVYDGTETLTADPITKTVKVVRGVRAKTAEEITAERKALVPQTITKWQAELILHDMGKLSAVQTVISADLAMSIVYQGVTTFERSNGLITQVATAQNIPDDVIDQMFIAASRYTAEMATDLTARQTIMREVGLIQ